MLRAVRFESRFGFRIENRTLELMSEAHDLLKQVSGDRVRHELDLMLGEEHPAAVLNRLDELGLLNAIQPGFHWNHSYTAALDLALKGEADPAWELPELIGSLPISRALAYLVWLLPYPLETGLEVCQRLRLPQALAVDLQAGQKLLPDLDEVCSLSPSRMVQRLDETPLPALYAIYCLVSTEKINQTLYDYATRLVKIQPLTDGYTLQSLGVEPGPIYRQILWSLRAAWLDGKIITQTQEKALLDQLLSTKILN